MLSEGPFNILRTPELLFRWMELSSVADAVFRSHPGVSGAMMGLHPDGLHPLQETYLVRAPKSTLTTALWLAFSAWVAYIRR